MKSRLTFLLILIGLCAHAQEDRKVLILGIDGCRHDALQAANTPHIDQLTDNSLHSFHSTTQAPTWSGVGWSSMLTGVWGEKHGVSDNSFSGNNFNTYPHIFNRIKEVNPDLYLSSICQWGPINDNVTDQGDNIQNVDSGQGVVDLAVEQLAITDLDVMFLHFDDVDHAGHDYGFSPDVPEYIEAIEGVDTHIGDVMNALNARPTIDQENWLVVISTDHGGIGTSHGGSSVIERNIFIIFSGDDYPNEELVPEYETNFSDSSNALNLNQSNVYGMMNNQVSTYDFDTNQDFTIELRIKTNGWTSDPSIISDKDWNNGFNPGFIVSCMTNENSWKFNIGDGDNRIDLDGSSINDGFWHHIAVSVNREEGIFIFQDGEVVNSTTESFLGDISSGLPLAFGQDGTLNYPAEFDGWMDEVRIWNEALSADVLEEWACENLSNNHPNNDALIGYWKMEEMGDFVTYDSSPSNNHMELVNGPYIGLEEALVCSSQTNQIPLMVDIAPTVLTHMCIEIDELWELDGEDYAENESGCTNSISESGHESHYSIVFPNPCESEFSFQYLSFAGSTYTLKDVLGRIHYSGKVSQGINHVELELISSGIHLFEIRNSMNQIVHQEKVIIH